MSPKFFLNVLNPSEHPRDIPLEATTLQAAVEEARKWRRSLVLGGRLELCENNVQIHGALNQNGDYFPQEPYQPAPDATANEVSLAMFGTR